jgi:hypothetical protein
MLYGSMAPKERKNTAKTLRPDNSNGKICRFCTVSGAALLANYFAGCCTVSSAAFARYFSGASDFLFFLL